MRTYHPASWSKQAREMADRQWEQFLYYSQPEHLTTFYKEIDGEVVEVPSNDIYNYVRFFSNSYRHDRIRERAAKRFGRLARKAGIELHFNYNEKGLVKTSIEEN